MHEFFRVGPWRISENGCGFETGTPTTGLVTLGFDQLAGLLVTNEPALTAFLQELSRASANRFGEEDFLVRQLGTYTNVQPTPPPPIRPNIPFVGCNNIDEWP